MGTEERKWSVNPVRNSIRALDPAGIILKCNPVATAGREGLWHGGNRGELFLTGPMDLNREVEIE